MFDRLFTLPAIRARHRDGPLADERERFLTHLGDLGLARRTLQGFAALLLVVADALDLVDRPGEIITRNEIRQKAAGTRICFIALTTRWLQFLGRLEHPPIPTSRYADKVTAFADYMRHQKDLPP